MTEIAHKIEPGSIRYFDDVEIGEELPPLAKGPLTTVHLMRWSAAVENWHRIHYDQRFAVHHDKLPDLLINGSLKQQFLFQMLKRWARTSGWIWKVNFQFRGMNLVGDTLRIWGRVAKKRDAGDFGLVDVELGVTGQDGLETTPGTACVALPFRDGRPLPYPFVPPNI